jgi:hypothetical protein
MEASSLPSREMPLARLSLAAGLALCVWLLLLATLFLIRRLSGAAAASLSPGAFLSAAFLLLAVVALARITGVRLLARHGNLGLRLAFLALPALAVVAMIWSLTSAAISVLPLILVLLGVAAEEGTWWTIYLWPRPARRSATVEPETSRLAPEPMPSANELQSLTSAPIIDDPEILPPNLLQQIIRVRTANGGEMISGVLRGDFLSGERNQNLHVAFCPPLAATPELSFEQVDGPSATIKAGQVESFGARLEVRLDAPAKESAQILVEFSATAEPQRRAVP